jgi:hypothetical protein
LRACGIFLPPIACISAFAVSVAGLFDFSTLIAGVAINLTSKSFRVKPNGLDGVGLRR